MTSAFATKTKETTQKMYIGAPWGPGRPADLQMLAEPTMEPLRGKTGEQETK